MRSLTRLAAAVPAALVLAAGCGAEPDLTSTAESAVTIYDTDFAPECGGIIAYANWAGYDELYSWLPVGVANALIDRRAVRPFVDIADISSVPGIAQGRLKQMVSRCYNLDFIDVECAGVYEELAVSYDDRTAIRNFLNTASVATLEQTARFEPAATAAAIVARRPHTTLQYMVDTYGIGPETFRAIRNAAITDPFDDLVNRINNVGGGTASVSTNFNWYDIVTDPGSYGGSVQECFGVDEDLVEYLGATNRPNLATGAEVIAAVTEAYNNANQFNQVGSATAGLAHLAALVQGQSFFGCYINYIPDPWSNYDRAVFVNTVTGYRVFTHSGWSE